MTWSIWTLVACCLRHSMAEPVYGSMRVMAMTTQSEPSRNLTFRPSRFSRSFRVSQPFRESGMPSTESFHA